MEIRKDLTESQNLFRNAIFVETHNDFEVMLRDGTKPVYKNGLRRPKADFVIFEWKTKDGYYWQVRHGKKKILGTKCFTFTVGGHFVDITETIIYESN